MEKELPIIAINIKKLREGTGWTQKQLGEMAGLSAKHISQLERGDSQAGKQVIAKLCEAFAVDEMTIRFGEREEPRHTPDDLAFLFGEVEKAFEGKESLADKHAFMAKVLAALADEGRNK